MDVRDVVVEAILVVSSVEVVVLLAVVELLSIEMLLRAALFISVGSGDGVTVFGITPE